MVASNNRSDVQHIQNRRLLMTPDQNSSAVDRYSKGQKQSARLSRSTRNNNQTLLSPDPSIQDIRKQVSNQSMRSAASKRSRGSRGSKGSGGRHSNEPTYPGPGGDEESGRFDETMKYQGKMDESGEMSYLNTDSEAEYVTEEEERHIPESTFDSDDYLLHYQNKQQRYLQEISCKIKLSKLYEVVSSSYTNQMVEYCPVLVKIVDPKLVQLINNENSNDPHSDRYYLLQLWDRKGQMVFETSTAHEILRMWVSEVQPSKNNNGCDTVLFIYLEDETVNVLVIERDRSMKPRLLYLPLLRTELRGIEFDYVAMNDGHLLLANQGCLYYVYLLEAVMGLKKFANKQISQEDFENKLLSLQFNKMEFQQKHHARFRGFHDMGRGECALIFENMDTHFLEFILIDIQAEEEKKLVFKKIECGIGFPSDQLSLKKYCEAPVVQLKSVVSRQKDCFNKKDSIHFCVSLRKDGSIDFYCNFILVSYIQAKKDRRFTKIDIDFNRIYFKSTDKKHEEQYFCCDLTWQKMVGSTTFKDLKRKELMERALHSRIAGNFRLYSQIVGCWTELAVSHRRFVTLFDLTNRKPMQTYEMQDCVTGMALLDTATDNINYRATVDNTQMKTMKQRELPGGSMAKAFRHTLSKQLGRDMNKEVKSYKIANSIKWLVVIEGTTKVRFLHLNASEISQSQVKKEFIEVPPILKVIQDTNRKRPRNIYFLMRAEQGESKAQSLYQKKGLTYSMNFSKWKDAYLQDNRQCQLVTFDGMEFEVIKSALSPDQNLHVYRDKLRVEPDKNSKNYDPDAAHVCKKHIVFSVGKQSGATQFFDTVDMDRYGAINECTPTFLKLKWAASDVKKGLYALISRKLEEHGARVGQMLASYKFVPYGQNAQTHFKIIEVRTDKICIFSKKGIIENELSNIFAKNCHFSDGRFLYVLLSPTTGSVVVWSKDQTTNMTDEDQDMTFRTSGLFVFDMQNVVESKKWIQCNKLNDAIVEVSDTLAFSSYANRLGFIQDFNEIIFMPLVHRNTLNFIGMESKQNYVAWREHEGKFTCLNKHGEINTWSVVSGKLIYHTQVIGMPSLQDFEIYATAQGDLTYKEDDYNFEYASYQLLIESQDHYNARMNDESVQKRKKNTYKKAQKLLAAPTGPIIKENRQEIDRLAAITDEQEVKLVKQDIYSQLSQKGLVEEESPALNINKDVFITDPTTLVELQESCQRVQQKQFKVLQMYTDPATKQITASERFNFVFQVFCTQENTSHSYPQQRLYLSEDTTKLLEILFEKGQATVFHRKDQRIPEPTKTVNFVAYRRVKCYPQMMDDRTFKNSLFDPNFEYMLNIDFKSSSFFIHNVRTNKKEVNIPNDLVSLRLEGQTHTTHGAMKLLASRIKMLTGKRVRIINKDNLDCILNFETTEVLSYVKVDNSQEKNHMPHYFVDWTPLDPTETSLRLFRTALRYKTWLVHAQSEIWSNVNKHMILKPIYSVDYSYLWEKNPSNFFAQQSFTMLDWIISEQVIKAWNREYTIERLPKSRKLMLAFNVFPGGQTFFHMLFRHINFFRQKVIQKQNVRGLDKYTLQTMETESNIIISEIYKIASHFLQEETNSPLNDVFSANKPLEVPLTQDIYGDTVLDMILKVKHYRPKQSQKFFHPAIKLPRNKIENHKDCDVASHHAIVIFESIKNYEFCHSGYLLSGAIIKAVQNRIPGIFEFLEARMRTPKHRAHIASSKLKTELRKDRVQQPVERAFSRHPNKLYYAAITAEPWLLHTEVTSNFFYQKQTAADQEYKLQFFDIPLLHTYSEEGVNFIDALNASKDPCAFNFESVNMIVRNQWDFAHYYYFWFEQFPFIITLASTYIIRTLIRQKETEENFLNHRGGTRRKIWDFCLLIIITYSVYSTFLELAKVRRRGFKIYFYEWLTILDVLSILGCYLFAWYAWNSQVCTTSWFWAITSVITPVMWWKLLNFMRVNATFDWMMAIMGEVVKTAMPFLVLMCFLLVGAGETFFCHSEYQRLHYDDPDKFYLTNFYDSLKMGFLLVLGDYDDKWKKMDGVGWAMFVLMSALTTLIMLRMLVVLFLKALDGFEQQKYRNRVSQLAFLNSEVFDVLSHTLVPYDNERNKLLFSVTEYESKKTMVALAEENLTTQVKVVEPQNPNENESEEEEEDEQDQNQVKWWGGIGSKEQQESLKQPVIKSLMKQTTNMFHKQQPGTTNQLLETLSKQIAAMQLQMDSTNEKLTSEIQTSNKIKRYITKNVQFREQSEHQLPQAVTSPLNKVKPPQFLDFVEDELGDVAQPQLHHPVLQEQERPQTQTVEAKVTPMDSELEHHVPSLLHNNASLFEPTTKSIFEKDAQEAWVGPDRHTIKSSQSLLSLDRTITDL